jgi:hypothetical protein
VLGWCPGVSCVLCIGGGVGVVVGAEGLVGADVVC